MDKLKKSNFWQIIIVEKFLAVAENSHFPNGFLFAFSKFSW